MDWRTLFYLGLALAYIGYPLYLLMGPAHAGQRKVLSLGLLAYGLAGLFWPGMENSFVHFLCGGMVVSGLAMMIAIPVNRAPWLLLMAYCLAIMSSPEVVEPASCSRRLLSSRRHSSAPPPPNPKRCNTWQNPDSVPTCPTPTRCAWVTHWTSCASPAYTAPCSASPTDSSSRPTTAASSSLGAPRIRAYPSMYIWPACSPARR